MAKQNGINDCAFTHSIGPFVNGGKFVNVFSGNITGTIDLYTCPSGKRALIMRYVACGGTSQGNLKLKVSGTYYTVNNSTLGGGTALNWLPLILEAGEIISVVVTSGSGTNLWLQVLEFGNTASIKTSKTLTLANGNNTIYTVPAGKTAYILDNQATTGMLNGAVHYFNNSGGTRTVATYVVPSGGIPGSGNQYNTTQSVSNGVGNTAVGRAISMKAGDFIVVNIDAGTATQTAWITLVEI